MVLLVCGREQARHAQVLEDMHRVRAQVFVEKLGWDVPVDATGQEKDQFDTEDAVYLIATDDHGRHLSSVRLLPSTAPHVLGALFDDLCLGGAPRAPDVWEISRLCSTPGLEREIMVRARRRVCAAIMEFASLRGIRRYSCAISTSWLPTFLLPGWTCTPLGPPQERKGDTLGAFAIEASDPALVRARFESPAPVLAESAAKAA